MRFWRTITSKINPTLPRRRARITLVLVLLLAPASLDVFAQKQFKKVYPARSNVNLQLKNSSGTVRVEVWNRNEIEVRAQLESSMQLNPQLSENGLEINVMHDNMRRDNLGDANFQIRVPANASVAVATMLGNIIVRGVQGSFVRASIGTRGDIELTEINTSQVLAETRGGDIFFAGGMVNQGIYRFNSWDGDVRLRLPQNAQFSLDARAPHSRNIDLGIFANRFNLVGEGRRAVGGSGASCDVMSARGSIFMLR